MSEASLLSIHRQQHQHETASLGTEMVKGMNPKKKHEVEYLASLVNKVMEDSQCNIVVDIGSGLVSVLVLSCVDDWKYALD